MARYKPLLALALPLARAAITVYQAPGQAAFATGSAAAAASAYTGAAAYNPTTLVAPPVPTPAVPSSFQIQLNNGGRRGNQVLGKNATHIQVPFLNLMANIQQRAGGARTRWGELAATLVPAASIPDGKILQKNLTGVTGTTQTPPLEYSDEGGCEEGFSYCEWTTPCAPAQLPLTPRRPDTRYSAERTSTIRDVSELVRLSRRRRWDGGGDLDLGVVGAGEAGWCPAYPLIVFLLPPPPLRSFFLLPLPLPSRLLTPPSLYRCPTYPPS
ncbi:hypothetical protein B0H13DRAFT_2666943 [Mycena leptocephala]|nr:hypothetical protein B0H13DRAFT_2666943 [Mycena leptocephala]